MPYSLYIYTRFVTRALRLVLYASLSIPFVHLGPIIMYVYPLCHEGTPLGLQFYTLFSALMVLLSMKGAVRLHI